MIPTTSQIGIATGTDLIGTDLTGTDLTGIDLGFVGSEGLLNPSKSNSAIVGRVGGNHRLDAQSFDTGRS